MTLDKEEIRIRDLIIMLDIKLTDFTVDEFYDFLSRMSLKGTLNELLSLSRKYYVLINKHNLDVDTATNALVDNWVTEIK